MENQIQLYHDMTAFYLDTERELQAEITRLTQELGDVKQQAAQKESQLKAEARQQWASGVLRGKADGDRQGYERGYQEAIRNGAWEINLGDFEQEIKAVDELNLGDDMPEKVRGICERLFQCGYIAARARYSVTYPCARCGQLIEVSSEAEKFAIRQHMKEIKFGHMDCKRMR